MAGGDTAKSKQQNKLDEYVNDLLHHGKYGFWLDQCLPQVLIQKLNKTEHVYWDHFVA